MWTHLEIEKATIENIFNPLHDKAKEYDRQWSIAELLLTVDDIKWLRAWFRCLTPDNTQNWVKSVMLTKLEDEGFVSYRQMFGSILICVAAEVCREESREDSVWPVIRRILADSPELQRELFLSNGQPSPLTKDVITDAVRALNLRHAMDIEGTQQWFTTIKLQFGFTYRGAKNRLAEWLVNLGRPHTVQYLIGDSDFPELASKSFQALWSAVTQYRRGLITESEIRRSLEGNPWVKAHWINDLQKEAKARISTIGIGDWHSEETETPHKGTSDEEFCPVRDIALKWPHGEPPRLRFHMDKQAIEDEVRETDIGELDFCIDGRKLCRWLRQGDGSWSGSGMIFAEPDTLKQQPNLNPIALTLQSGTGDPLVEWDFADSGLSEEVLVFDLDRERIVNASSERLEPNRHYAILCDRKCEIQGCDSVETFGRNNIRRKVVRLPSPLNQNLCVVYEDFVLWQPVREETDQRPHFSLTLSTPTGDILSLNDRTKLLLTGLPEDANAVRLLIHTKTYELERHGEGWLTLKDITVTPELAARQRRVRVRFSSENRAHTQEPRLAFSLLGAAMYRHKQDDNSTISFEVLKKGEHMNRSEGTTTIRIWTPGQGKETDVLEGTYRVGRLRHQKVRLRDFPGHGAQLHIISEGQRYNLGVTCIDTGCVRDFVPSMLGCDAQMFLLSDKNPAEAADDGYALYLWFVGQNHKAKFNRIPVTSILPTSKNRIWKIRDSCSPMAIALTWKGYWLGAWWSCELIRDYINWRGDLPEHDFAILMWLRVPVLHSTLSPILKKAVLCAPCRFIKTWLHDSSLPDGIRPHDHIGGLDSVVRRFLWNDFPVAYSKDAIALVTEWNGKANQEDYDIGHLARLSDISPILLWKGMEYHLKQSPQTTIPLIYSFTREQVGLLSSASEQQMRIRLQGLEKRVLQGTGIEEERLKAIVWDRIRGLQEKRWCPLEQDCADLLKLGQTHSGRRYLSARIGLHWLELSR